MCNTEQKQGADYRFFKAKKANLASVTLKKISATSNGAKFYNSYRDSQM